jgi:hypothetical protein
LTDNPGGGGHDCFEEFTAVSKSSKIILIAVGALAGIVVLIATVAAVVLRVNARPRVEAIASEALGWKSTSAAGWPSVSFQACTSR